MKLQKKEGVKIKTVYILLTRTGTLPSRLIHSFVRGKYTHASLAIRPRTDEFYSFARRTLRNPLNAGFIIEDIHTFVFSKYPDSDCAVYSLEVSDDAYERLENTINKFVSNPRRYNYNFLGLLPAKLGIEFNRKYHYTCSQFVATLLHSSGAVALPKPPSLMMPCDFLKIPNITPVYEGKLKNCKIRPVNQALRSI